MSKVLSFDGCIIPIENFESAYCFEKSDTKPNKQSHLFNFLACEIVAIRMPSLIPITKYGIVIVRECESTFTFYYDTQDERNKKFNELLSKVEKAKKGK